MVPTGEVDPEASKWVGEPGEPGTELKAAVGAWSGVMAMASGPLPTAIVDTVVFVTVAMGVTVLSMKLAT